MNKKRTLALLAALVVMTGSLCAGCGKKEAEEEKPETKPQENIEEQLPEVKQFPSDELEGTVLRWNMGELSEKLDPAFAVKTTSRTLLLNLMEGLYRWEGNTVVPAGAAELPVKAEQDDTVTYTITLRDGLRWSDGNAVKAADFLYGWTKAAKEDNGSPYEYLFAPMTNPEGALNVTADSDTTLVITTEEAIPNLEQLLAMPAFLPVREDLDTEEKPDIPEVVNGPYKVKAQEGGELLLEKNSQYWNASQIKVDYISGRTYEGKEAVEAWEADALDFSVSGINPDGSEAQDQNSSVYVLVNTATDNAALKKSKVRLALSSALDRSGFHQGRSANGIVPYTVLDSQGNSFRQGEAEMPFDLTADVEGAKALLTEAETTEISVTLTTDTSDFQKKLAEELTAQWKELGVTLTVEALEPAEYAKVLANHTYKDMILAGWVGDTTDAMEFLSIFASGSLRSGNGYSRLAYDKALVEADSAEGAERDAALHKAEAYLMQDALVMPLICGQTWTLQNDRLSGDLLTPMGTLWFGAAQIAAETPAK